MAPFYGWCSTASRLQSHYKEAVYFIPLSSEEFLVLLWLTLRGWKTESTLEPPSGFEHRTPGLRIQCLYHLAIAPCTVLSSPLTPFFVVSIKVSIVWWFLLGVHFLLVGFLKISSSIYSSTLVLPLKCSFICY